MYNNNGKVFVYSSEVLTNPQKNRPLIGMSINEDPPRYYTLFYDLGLILYYTYLIFHPRARQKQF